jgi:hypothetical protein
MAVTVATVIKNVCFSRRRKAELESFRSCIQTLACITHLVAQTPEQTPRVQSVHNLARTEAGPQNTVATKQYVKMGRMSNQRKAEFIGDIFHAPCFWGDHGKISSKTYFIQEGIICQKCYFSDRSSF